MVKLIRKGKKKKGFTLIELVAVVAIIGILAALLVPKIAGYIGDAKKTKVIDQARQVHMAVQTRNTKEDTQLDLTSTKVSTALADATVTKYMVEEGETITLANDFPNLDGDMTIDQCKRISKGADFKITSAGVVDKSTIATS